MKKIAEIKGMSCEHCKKRVEKALLAIDGITAEVDLKKARAVISYEKEVSDDVVKAAIEEAGYQLVSIKEKKELFGN